MNEQDQDHCLFVVRVWREPRPVGDPAPWRGSVEQIPGGQRYYFAAVAVLADFFALRLHFRSPAPPAAQSTTPGDAG